VNKTRTLVLAVTAAAIVIGVPSVAATLAQAGPRHDTSVVYVATHGKSGARDQNCDSAAYDSVNAAIAAVPTGGTVIACSGTYREDVTITKPLSLRGNGHVVIDATNQTNGVLVKANHVMLSGLTVTNAIGEGVLVLSSKYVTVERNVVEHNDLGGLPVNPVPNSYQECQAQQGVPGDCGEGIHLMGVTYSTVDGNVSTGNSGGILVSDETGPTAHNRITGNTVTDNVLDCGITVVGHNTHGVANGVPAPSVAGVYDNLVRGNRIDGNGTQGEGAGVVIATGPPGGAVYDNTVEDNSIDGNGLSGVTVHSHAPGQFLNGNVVRDNEIGTNNLSGDKDFTPAVDLQTTGVLVATVAPLSIEVSGNQVHDDHFGVWTTGPVTANGEHDNTFRHVDVSVANT
jgi:parallel beta-helix repeat protein